MLKLCTKLCHFGLLICTFSFTSIVMAAENIIEPLMITIPGGEFLMGSNHSHSEQPIHKVTLKAFQLAKYSVTTKEFLQFTAATGYQPSGSCLFKVGNSISAETPSDWLTLNKVYGDFAPIVCVSWRDAQAYSQWLSAKTGKHYRLPSEAEWEYAERAGSNDIFHFGSNEKQLCQYANGYDLTAAINIGLNAQTPNLALVCDDQEAYLSRVGMYQPNAFGLYDMQGNVSQWVADCYYSNYQGAPQTGKAWQSKDCSVQFARGGSWATTASHFRSSFRPEPSTKVLAAYDRGFRLALDAQVDAGPVVTDEQKSFIKDLAKAQQVDREKRLKLQQERELLKKNRKLWAKTPLLIPPMVTIPSGNFLMGDEANGNTKPVHKVNVNAFKISQYEVTIKQFKQFIAATDYPTGDNCWKFVDENGGPFNVGYTIMPGHWLTPDYAPSDFHPVMCVSWEDANAYLAWLSRQTGKKYRLPTEAEWEYAGRAGTTTPYFWGSEENQRCQYGNEMDKSGMRAFTRDKGYKNKEMDCDDGSEYTSIVGMYKPNAFGIYDMTGNVSEWVEDCDHPNFEGAPTDGSAWISEKCNMHSRKGSSYGIGSSRIATRGHGGQNNRSSLGEGFRIVEVIQADPACAESSSKSCIENTDIKNPFIAELKVAQQAERLRLQK